jgi:hypothetical protein
MKQAQMKQASISGQFGIDTQILTDFQIQKLQHLKFLSPIAHVANLLLSKHTKM